MMTTHGKLMQTGTQSLTIAPAPVTCQWSWIRTPVTDRD